MPQHLVISVRFLQPWFHGRTETSEPEWPPSPLRLFQAMVASSSRRWTGPNFAAKAEPFFHWLERQPAPRLLASRAVPATKGYRLFVPDNVADLMAAKWAKGKDASIADYRTEKDVRPSQVKDGAEVHFVYAITESEGVDFSALIEAARALTHLGWGIDQVAGNAAILDDIGIAGIAGESWLPVYGHASVRTRIPTLGTLDDLKRRYAGFLARIGPEGFKPVPMLTAFTVVGYRRATDPVGRPCAAFALRTMDGQSFKAFDPIRRTRDVAGMMRHAVADMAKRQGWAEARINTFVHGKSVDGAKLASGVPSPDRFSYLPIPTVNHRLGRVEAIRRILVTAPLENHTEVHWARQALAGTSLQAEATAIPMTALLVPLENDGVLRCFIDCATTWVTVTPVILSGYDDRSPTKAERLLRLALVQTGFNQTLVDQVQIEWRGVGFLPGVDLASRYLPPENLNHRPRYHVRLRFPHPVAGPLAVGSGRFRGFGLFVQDR